MDTYPVVLAGTVGGRRVVGSLIIELVAIKHEINFRAAGRKPQKQNEPTRALKSMLHAWVAKSRNDLCTLHNNNAREEEQ